MKQPRFTQAVCDVCANRSVGGRDLSRKLCADFGRHIRMTGRPYEVRFCCREHAQGYGVARHFAKLSTEQTQAAH